MAGMSEATKNASPLLLPYGGRRVCKPVCRWTRSPFFKRSWSWKKPNGAISHELAQRSCGSGKHAAEISVRPADGFYPDSILYRGNGVNHQRGMVGLSQGLGQHFSVAGLAAAVGCLVLREAPRRPHRSRIVAGSADRAAILYCTPGTLRSLADRRRTSCRQRRIDVDRRDPAYA